MAGFQQGSADGDVFAGEADAIAHGARTVADLQLQIPKDVKHGFNDAFRPGRDFPRGQEQQIDIGRRGHFGPAITAHGQNRQAFRFGGVGGVVEMAARQFEGDDHQPVGQMALPAGQGAGFHRAGRKGCGQCCIAGGAGLGQMADHQRAGGAGIGFMRQFALDQPGEGAGVDDLDPRQQHVLLGNCGAVQAQNPAPAKLRGRGR